MHIDEPGSVWPTASTFIIACAAATALTFCTPAPAAEPSACHRVAAAFVAIVDDVTSEEDAKAAAERVPQDYRALLVEAVQAYIAIGGAIPLEDAVPIVFKRCMEKGGA